jgi:NAD(P)-dependent dehydrogenase (short-subunit alcohol dehydrogenase family)
MNELQSSPRLDGRTALITGASRGIGLAIAKEYLRHGANVCITARRQNELDAARDGLDAISATVPRAGIAMDFAGSVGDAARIEACVDAVLDRFGRLDVLVNNAATSPAFGPLMDVELAAWRKTFAVNVEGPLLFAQQAWRRWMRLNGGVIINVTTIGVHRPRTLHRYLRGQQGNAALAYAPACRRTRSRGCACCRCLRVWSGRTCHGVVGKR